VRRLLDWAVAEGDRDPANIAARVRARPGRLELLAVASIVLILLLSLPYSGSLIDWEIFAGAADGTYVSDVGLAYYYAYWLLPLFDFYALFGLTIGGLLWSLTNVAGVWFAARVFGARPAVVLVGFGAIYGFYTGTITGIAVAGLAGMWWAAHENQWTLLGALTLIASAKPQWGLPLALIIVMQAAPPQRVWVRMAAAPVTALVLSVAAFGWWPAEIWHRSTALPPVGNASLWALLGPVVAVLWLPTILPMVAHRRLALVAVTAMLAAPYIQHYDYVVLWVIATDGIGLLSYSHGPLERLLGPDGARTAQLVMPITAYGVLVTGPVKEAWRQLRLRRAEVPAR